MTNITLKAVWGILLAGTLSNNYALLHFLGTGAVLENQDHNCKQSMLLGLGVTCVMVIANLITWPIDAYILDNAAYLQPIVFVIVILIIAEVLKSAVKGKAGDFCNTNFAKFAINGAILGLCIHNTANDYLTAVINSAAVGIGFAITQTVFGELRQRIDEDAVPRAFRGLPINILIAGFMALAILAF